MKVNLPVTQREIPVPESTYLVSKTDLKGIITEANEAFVAISGFSSEELLGRNHNLVRHPDMPQAAFGDMWRCLHAGMPWRGIVKNRAKNGDHYWVDALIVPMTRHGALTGYMSVRRAASRAQIREAEALYAQLGQTGKVAGITHTPWQLSSQFYLMLGATFALILLNILIVLLGLPTWLGVLASVLALLPLGALFWLAHVRIFRPLTTMRQQIDRLAEGDLANRYPIEVPNEIGAIANAFAVMQTRWLVSLDHIQRAIEQTRSGIVTVEKKTSTIETHIERQHDRVASTAAATEEFYQSIAEVASSAAETAKAASTSEARVSENQQTLHGGMAAADQVVSAVSHSNEVIGELNRAVGKIGAITQVIKEIADQTNLLALNAAIEAARAGETGRGFAVVADEVRKLAERTGGSTNEIAQTVASIQQLALDVGQSMGNAADSVASSTDMMRQSVAALGEVAVASVQTVSMARHIANAAGQQKEAGEEIAINMEQVSQLSEQNQQELRDLALSMKQLEAASGRISEAVRAFKTI